MKHLYLLSLQNTLILILPSFYTFSIRVKIILQIKQKNERRDLEKKVI